MLINNGNITSDKISGTDSTSLNQVMEGVYRGIHYKLKPIKSLYRSSVNLKYRGINYRNISDNIPISKEGNISLCYRGVPYLI